MIFADWLQRFMQAAAGTHLDNHLPQLEAITQQVIADINQGDLPRWLEAHHALPDLPGGQVDTAKGPLTVTYQEPLTAEQSQQLKEALMGLHPWRKGPFQVADCLVDAEWRSNLKWDRLIDGLPDVSGKTVLDVGCGNGYYLMKMAALNPRLAMGIEPGLIHNIQFWSIEQYAKTGVHILPLKIQQLPTNMACFDLVMSMGVLYHRKSPIEHLEHLKSLLQPGGTMIMETLVVEGDECTCLVPPGRYAQMRNVWFLPSVPMLQNWLHKIGMRHIEVVDVSVTTTDEQRSTDWMRFHSLPEFLSADQSKTVEGHPPPRRVIIRSQR